jgi:uncharacterized DUF497 family protein
MKIVWDEPKRQTNLLKHGLDFADVPLFDWRNAKVYSAKPDDDGRARLKAVGRFGTDTTVVIFALLGTEAMSIISFRLASGREKKVFDER